MALIEIDIEKKVNSCSRESHKRFGSVAPDGWSDSDSNIDFENDPGAANKKRLSLHRDSKRFKFAKPKEIDELKQPNLPLNTKRNMNWAVKNLQTWWEWHNSAVEDKDELCPEIVVTSKCTVELLNKWLPVYVMETRNKNGDPYPPKTLYSLLTGILRHMRTENPSYPNFLGGKNPPFVEFHRSLNRSRRCLMF